MDLPLQGVTCEKRRLFDNSTTTFDYFRLGHTLNGIDKPSGHRLTPTRTACDAAWWIRRPRNAVARDGRDGDAWLPRGTTAAGPRHKAVREGARGYGALGEGGRNERRT